MQSLICGCKASTHLVQKILCLAARPAISPNVLEVIGGHSMKAGTRVPSDLLSRQARWHSRRPAAHVRAQLMALSSSFDSVLVRAKGVSLQPTCVRMCRAAQAALACQRHAVLQHVASPHEVLCRQSTYADRDA